MGFLTLLSCYLMLQIQGLHGRPMLPQANDPATGCNSISEGEAMRQLVQFGYAGIPVSTSRQAASARFPDTSTFRESLKDFQRTVGLPESGVLDVSTRCKMATPRCAQNDVSTRDAVRRQRAVAAGGGQAAQSAVSSGYTTPYGSWSATDKANLTWNVLDNRYDLADVSESDTDSVFRKQFEKWEAAADICFFHNKGAAQDASKLDIQFVPGSHDSYVPNYSDGGFAGGQGGVLAHAYFPYGGSSADGDTHFDIDDVWRTTGAGSYPEFDLGWVALHEFGHAIGLGHSTESTAVMYPYYPNNDANEAQLASDDIAGAQSLYGAAVGECTNTLTTTTSPTTTTITGTTTTTLTTTTTTPTTTTATTTTTEPGTSDCSIDAAFGTRWADYIIKGGTIIRYSRDYVSLKETAMLSAALPAVDEPIIAAADNTHVIGGINHVFLMSSTNLWIYIVRNKNTIASSFASPPIKYTLARAFKTTFTASAAFMDKCRFRVSGKTRTLKCIFIIVGNTFYQYRYNQNRATKPYKLFKPIVNGVQVKAASSMPLTKLNDYTKDKTFPSKYESTGVDAVVELKSDFLFFKNQDFIKMNENQNGSEDSRGSISTMFDCTALVAPLRQFASNNLGAADNEVVDDGTADQIKRSETDVLST